MKIKILTAMAIASVMVLSMGISVFAEEPAENGEAYIADTDEIQDDADAIESEENEETVDDASAEGNEETEEEIKDKTELKQEKEMYRRERLNKKEKKIEAARNLREMKLLAKVSKIEALTNRKELKALLRNADEAEKQELLAELAAVEEKLKAYLID